jgi:hypothetical protein
MKILPKVVLFLVCFIPVHYSFCQDSLMQNQPALETQMQDTMIALNPSFKVRNVYARKDRYDAIRDSIRASLAWSAKMHDTVILKDPSFNIIDVYAEKDSLANIINGQLGKKDSLVKAIKDSLNALGSILMHTADMQDTTIAFDPSFTVRNVYATKDSLSAIRDSLRILQAQAATMQDTAIVLDPSFVVRNLYAGIDSLYSVRDSLRSVRDQAAQMQDTAIILDPSFVVFHSYDVKDRQDAIRDSLARPTIMQDTVISIDSSFIVRDLYPLKDSLEAIRDSLTARTDSLYSDSVRVHWAGWSNYEVQPDRTFTFGSKTMLKGKTKTDLQYNIADFYLFLNGEPVMPPTAGYDFFAAACLGFRYDDTLLLNSGLGSRVGVGVGIKIIQGKFTSTLHANMHNTQIYKLSQDDSGYVSSVIVMPSTQSLVLKYFPDGSHGEIVIGEYQATYDKFYQKTDEGDDELRRYKVRIIFRCRVSGGINSFK